MVANLMTMVDSLVPRPVALASGMMAAVISAAVAAVLGTLALTSGNFLLILGLTVGIVTAIITQIGQVMEGI